MNQTQITTEMTINEIFEKFPHKSQHLAQELTNSGLHCVGCHAATWETLEAGVLGHGKSQEELEELLNKLNSILKEEKADPTQITITERAAKKFLQICEEENKQGWGLRLSEKAAGCNGYEFVLDFSEASSDEDIIFTSHSVEIQICKANKERLLGSEIDYLEGLNGAGFKVSNPNVQSSCGCGTSHSY